ncbi:ribosome silencing factor [Candidatus Chlorohelix sp.]|uniref:ribosome silencing factor n=1 Tax=Candidatus Chlorohelix sp. TaxID=3139201 RepID=UPI0031453BC7
MCVRPFRYQGVDTIESNELARLIVELAEDKKASNIILLDIRDVSILADYFVICSGNSERQVKAIARDIEERLKEQEVMVSHREGMDQGRWVLLDYSDVIVHVFTPTERDYYRLDKLWSGAQTVLVVQ